MLELHIELKGVKPTVTRTVHLHRETTFQELHHVIQLLFDFWDAYPYRFLSQAKRQEKTNMLGVPDSLKKRTLSSRNSSSNRLLTNELKEIGDEITYEYGMSTCWTIVITLNKQVKPLSNSELYPICINAENELLHKSNDKKEALLFPFGKQKALQHEDLVKRLNKKLTENLEQFSLYDIERNIVNCWDRLHGMTEQYYEVKPWKTLTNQQVFAIYDDRFDEYLFCSVLGNDEGMYGLSVYIGFNGLLSLHTSLTKKLSIEQLFQLHENLLLSFETKDYKQEKDTIVSPVFFSNEKVAAQFTSYKPGYFPWKIDEKEASMFSFALEQTIHLYKMMEKHFTIPNYIEEDRLLLLSRGKDNRQMKQTTVTFEQIIKKVLPLQLTLSQFQLEQLKEIERVEQLTVEFSLQYVNVPIQRLKEHRPFLPLSSVITDQKTKQIIYHNIYNARLDYSLVQAEFIHMISLLGVLPGEILTDELTYHYLKPILFVQDLPLKVNANLEMTKQINDNVSDYLLSRAE